MQYPTCCHIKLDGTYCGSPSLRDRKYCYHHLMQRGRRLRRARALRDNLPYRIELPLLTDLDAVQFALSEITQAVGTGQLDQRAAGKMLYAIQQATSIIKFRAKLEATQSQTSKKRKSARSRPSLGAMFPCANSRIEEYPDFEKHLGLAPGADIDAETTAVLQQAAEEEQDRRAYAIPEPPPGVRLGSAAYRVYRDEVFQGMRLELDRYRHELRDYHAQKRQQLEESLKKEGMMSAPAAPQRIAG